MRKRDGISVLLKETCGIGILASLMVMGCGSGGPESVFDPSVDPDGGSMLEDAATTDDVPGTADSGVDANGDSDVPDSGSKYGCQEGEKRCLGPIVQFCDNAGYWRDEAYCEKATPVCSAGACHPKATSCDEGTELDETCGPGERCCVSTYVPGGYFYRSYDGVTTGYDHKTYPAVLAGFRLDKYEVTVGRFRRFTRLKRVSWEPAVHSHLFEGRGLNGSEVIVPSFRVIDAGLVGGGSTFSPEAWSGALNCDEGATWTDEPGDNENKPINCVNWYEANLFCAWDGGFLPSEAEWNYAASGGPEHRVYPWSNPADSFTINQTFANFDSAGALPVGSKQGAGKWGHADLAGNLKEWVLDAYGPYPNPCTDCAHLPIVHPEHLPYTTHRAVRGGGYASDDSGLANVVRDHVDATQRRADIGFRCARIP